MLQLRARRPVATPALLVQLLLGIAVTTAPAAAQVTTSQQALDALGSDHAAQPAPAAHPPSPRRRRVAHPMPAAGGKPVRAASAHPPAPTIPPGPPPAPVFRAPLIDVPLHPPPPPLPVPVVQTATGLATPLADGARITFGVGSADLNPTTMRALHDVSDRLRASPASRVDLDAFGSVTEDDPSTPRRLAFQRGVAARAVLINDGIASTRIYLRVIGEPAATAGADGASPDRVDLLLSPAIPGAPSAGPASAGPSTSAAAIPGHPTR